MSAENYSTLLSLITRHFDGQLQLLLQSVMSVSQSRWMDGGKVRCVTAMLKTTINFANTFLIRRSAPISHNNN